MPGRAAMTAEEFNQWLDANAYDYQMLADDLGVHRLTVVKWAQDKHPMDQVTVLALRHLERDKRALKNRRRRLDDPSRPGPKRRPVAVA